MHWGQDEGLAEVNCSGKDLRKRSALASIGRAVGLEPPRHSPFSDDGSDLSFVCADSRKLAETGQIA